MTEEKRENGLTNRLIDLIEVPRSYDQRNANFSRAFRKRKGRERESCEEAAKAGNGNERQKEGRESEREKDKKRSGSRHMAAVPVSPRRTV